MSNNRKRTRGRNFKVYIEPPTIKRRNKFGQLVEIVNPKAGSSRKIMLPLNTNI